MKNSILDLAGSSLIPILRADIAAGSSGNVHSGLIAVAAVGALPNELAVCIVDDLDLAVVSALLAEIALGVQLGVHDVIVNILHHGKDGVKVVLHIRHFDVGNCTAGRKLLEFTFKFQLGKRVDFFRYVHVIAVRDIILIRHARDHAKTLLQSYFTPIEKALPKATAAKRKGFFIVFKFFS